MFNYLHTQLPTFIERTVMMACVYMLSRATLTTSFSSFTGVTNLVNLIKRALKMACTQVGTRTTLTGCFTGYHH